MEGRRFSLCSIIITTCLVLMVATTVLLYYFTGFNGLMSNFTSISESSDDVGDNHRVQRQVIYNEEPTTPAPVGNEVKKTLDAASILLKHGPQFALNLGGRIFESEMARVLGTNIINKRTEPESHIFSVVKRQ